MRWNFEGGGLDHAVHADKVYINWKEQKYPIVPANGQFTISQGDMEGGPVALWAKAVAITATLDTVIFDDGGVIGPQLTIARPFLAQKIQARQDLMLAFLENAKNTSRDELGIWLQQDRDSNANAPNDLYKFHRTDYAKALLGLYQSGGLSAATDYANSILSVPTLVLH